jgi:hypothetical protein
MESRALPPQAPQQHLSILSDECDVGQVHDRLSTLLGRKILPAAFQLVNPRAGKTTFQSEPYLLTRPVRRNPQHNHAQPSMPCPSEKLEPEDSSTEHGYFRLHTGNIAMTVPWFAMLVEVAFEA